MKHIKVYSNDSKPVAGQIPQLRISGMQRREDGTSKTLQA
jgi:hypothetical protein